MDITASGLNNGVSTKWKHSLFSDQTVSHFSKTGSLILLQST